MFFNYGFNLVAARAKDRKRVEDWWGPEDEPQQTEAQRRLQRVVRQYVRDAWIEWLTLDNVACVWRKENPRPIAYPPENTEYADLFGLERLTLQHGLNTDALKKVPGLKKAEEKALSASSQLVIEKTGPNAELFGFDVVKREKVGNGYAWPGLAVVFQVCSQQEGMEVGDALRGNLLRNVIEQHKVGHEIKNGPFAGSKAHFCTESKAANVDKSLKGKVGWFRLVTNFDHEIEFPAPASAVFDAKRYDGVFRRLETWSTPLGQMVNARGLNPYLTGVLKVQAEGERQELLGHFNEVLNETMSPPAEVTAKWGNQCFWDERLMLQLMQTGLAGGPLSQTTWLKHAGFDPEKERELKAEEAGLPEKQVMPLYDPHHGPPGKTAGRKRGTADGQGE